MQIMWVDNTISSVKPQELYKVDPEVRRTGSGSYDPGLISGDGWGSDDPELILGDVLGPVPQSPISLIVD